MSGTLEFPPQTPQQRRKTRRRPLGNKLQELATRAPEYVYAIETLADFLLNRLDVEASQAHQNGP